MDREAYESLASCLWEEWIETHESEYLRTWWEVIETLHEMRGSSHEKFE